MVWYSSHDVTSRQVLLLLSLSLTSRTPYFLVPPEEHVLLTKCPSNPYLPVYCLLRPFEPIPVLTVQFLKHKVRLWLHVISYMNFFSPLYRYKIKILLLRPCHPFWLKGIKGIVVGKKTTTWSLIRGVMLCRSLRGVNKCITIDD